jgi:hypothetical protein
MDVGKARIDVPYQSFITMFLRERIDAELRGPVPE